MTVARLESSHESRIAGESCGESSGDCHNVIAGRRQTRFLNVLKPGFPAAPATLPGYAINCVPVHRVFGWEERRKQDLPQLNGVNFRAPRRRACSCMPSKVNFGVSGGISGGFVACFASSRQKPMRASQAVLIGCYGKM